MYIDNIGNLHHGLPKNIAPEAHTSLSLKFFTLTYINIYPGQKHLREHEI